MLKFISTKLFVEDEAKILSKQSMQLICLVLHSYDRIIKVFFNILIFMETFRMKIGELLGYFDNVVGHKH